MPTGDNTIPALIRMPFSLAEFEDRRRRVTALMERDGLDVIVLTSTPNYYYVSGLPFGFPLGVFGLALTRDGRGFWIGRHTEMTNVRTFMVVSGWSEIARSITDDEDSYEVFGQALGKLVGPTPRIGFELDSRSIPSNGVAIIARQIPGIDVRNASGLVESLRVIKSPAELDYLRTAGRMTAAAIRETVEGLHDGQTDSGLAARAFAALTRLGSDPLPTLPMVTAGPRSALAHSTFENIPIKRGELVTLEMGAVAGRYCAPAYRIAVLGQPSAEVRRFHDASRAGLLAALEKLGPGITSHEGDQIVRDAIGKAGYLDDFTVRAGYSIGLGFVPSWDEDHIMKLRPNDQRIVKPGMVFHVVPALYRLGLGAACCSNSLHITENGVEALVPIEPELLIVN